MKNRRSSDALFLLHAFEYEFTDKTVYDQAHQSDISIMDHYQRKLKAAHHDGNK